MELVRSRGSFLAGGQSGDRAQHRLEVLSSAEVTGQSAPVLQVADAVLDANPLRGVGPTFGLVGRDDGGEDRDLVLPPGRPRGDHGTGGRGAQALVAGVGEQGDTRDEGTQLDQAGLADLGQIVDRARAGLSARQQPPLSVGWSPAP